jgi:hypothetical protein
MGGLPGVINLRGRTVPRSQQQGRQRWSTAAGHSEWALVGRSGSSHTMFSLKERWGLLDPAEIGAAFPCRAGPCILSLNHNEVKFQDGEKQKWSKESFLGFYSLSIIKLNSVQIFFSRLHLSTCRWHWGSDLNSPRPQEGKCTRFSRVQHSPQSNYANSPRICSISPQTTMKISNPILQHLETQNWEMGSVFLILSV